MSVDGDHVIPTDTAAVVPEPRSASDLEPAVLAVFVEVLALPGGADPASLRYAETPGWDSLAHMELVSCLEESFDVMFETDDILGMRDIAAAIEILGRLGADLG